jgi:amidase
MLGEEADAQRRRIGLDRGRERCSGDWGRDVPVVLVPVTAGLADMGRSVSGAALLGARELAQSWTRRLVAWWLDGGWDLLLTPVLPDPPVRTGEADDLRLITFAAPFNVSGLPAASVPGRRTDEGLPIGVQFVAGPWREDVVLAAAAQVERAQPWQQRPDL